MFMCVSVCFSFRLFLFHTHGHARARTHTHTHTGVMLVALSSVFVSAYSKLVSNVYFRESFLVS